MTLNDDEIALIATSIAQLYHKSTKRGTTAFVICSDGKLRRMDEAKAVGIITAVCELSGKNPGVTLDTARQIAKEANHG